MTTRARLAAFSRRHRSLPLVAGALVLSVSLALAYALQGREDADLRRTVALKANWLATLTTRRLADRNTELVRLALHWSPDEHSRASREEEALRSIQMGAFRSVTWIDSLGRTIGSVPDETSAAPIERAVADARVAMAREARRGGQVATSDPIFTAQGVPIVVSAAPTARGEAAVVGETSLPSVLRQAIGGPDILGYSFAIYANGKELFVNSSGPRDLETNWGQEAELSDTRGGWRLRAWPTPAEMDVRDSHLPGLVILVGFLFAAAVASMMFLYQTADLRAFALSVANTRLETEIFERARAQERLESSEEQLRQSQKMEAVGRLAGGIAHDFNNLLTAIGGYADFLLADIDRSDPRRDDVREIKKAATRAGALTSQLLAFSRRQIRQPRSLDLNAVLTDLERMLRRVIGEDVTIDWRPSDRLGSVRADPSEIEQVMLNLVVNAGDAMPNGGVVSVTTCTVDFTGADLHPELPPGRYVRLRVADTGMGMDAATRRRIFEPFFTTKGPGKGTGLGLSTVYGIVENLRGTIDVESTPGSGTTFSVYLPQHEEPAEVIGSGTIATLAPRGVETILLVEDEEGIRALGARILERHGYTVLEAREGRDALTVAAQHGGRIDLLLTDVVMPEMGGKQLAETLMARDPSVRVLFVSGYTDGDISRRGELDPCTAFLQKPFTARSLLARVREVLDDSVVVA